MQTEEALGQALYALRVLSSAQIRYLIVSLGFEHASRPTPSVLLERQENISRRSLYLERITSREEEWVNAMNSIDSLTIDIGDMPRSYRSTLLTCRLSEK